MASLSGVTYAGPGWSVPAELWSAAVTQRRPNWRRSTMSTTNEPTLTELHRRWMHARLAHEQAERALEAARRIEDVAGRDMRGAANKLAALLLKDKTVGLASRQRRRRVSIAGEALDVYERGVDYPGEYCIEVIPLELVPLD